jgi:hypothetical protein
LSKESAFERAVEWFAVSLWSVRAPSQPPDEIVAKLPKRLVLQIAMQTIAHKVHHTPAIGSFRLKNGFDGT